MDSSGTTKKTLLTKMKFALYGINQGLTSTTNIAAKSVIIPSELLETLYKTPVTINR